MDLAGLASDLLVGLVGAGIASLVGNHMRARQSDKDERIWRIVRYLKAALDRLELLMIDEDGNAGEIEETKSSIRSYGIEAHDIDGVCGMDRLLRQVADLKIEKADFYEMKVDKIWDFIGYENGRISKKGIWVA